MGTIFLFVCIFVYMLPTLIAWRRNSEDLLAISILNVCLGWSVLMWIIAALWALVGDPNDEEHRN
jgi:hypothetical protein